MTTRQSLSLTVVAVATRTEPDGHPDIPRLPGFVESTFNPLLFDVAQRCLTAAPGDPSRTAVVLGGLMGDSTTFDLTSQRMVAGQVHNPLLFMQATSNSVLGYLSREFGITGPMSCLSVSGGLAGELLLAADLVLDTAEVDRVLLLGVELAANERTGHAYRLLADSGGQVGPPVADVAVALLVERGAGPVEITSIGAAEDLGGAPAPGGYGSVQGLVHLALGCTGSGAPGTTTLVHDPTAPAEQAVVELTHRDAALDKGPEA
ncbi:ketosynthase [Allokutzneria sp. A3M-2-11 16]|uniref:ketosynthase n=1 Tax=Allokutzneria sp. A3M-2-11 16 TaxID=2962043 RepID=UPI0020B65768|nr:ketosynthase [Allokutzneria sp. A3M-2-11 16]MCP3799391.1 ketosynthase [Allokutzneria sp. A3M-2-11 16]